MNKQKKTSEHADERKRYMNGKNNALQKKT